MQLAGKDPIGGANDIGVCVADDMQDAIGVASLHAISLGLGVVQGALLLLLAEEPKDGTAVPDPR